MANAEAAAYHLDILLRVLDPRGRVGGEVRVLRKDLLGRHERFELNQVALLAREHSKREERLHLPDLLGA
jgi:hypothetical protein